MKTTALVAALAALLILPVRADAQQLNLQIQNGRVTLDAQNVTVRQILAEWARVGGAKIVNGDKVAGGPVTLQLNGVSERQALDTILRGVSGYMLASRQVPSTGASGFDRILILPTSSAPRGNPAPANTAFQRPAPVPVAVEAEPVDTEIVEDDDFDEPDPDAGDEGGDEVVQPQPGMNPRFNRRGFPNPMGTQGQPFTPQGNFPGAVQPQPVDPDEEGEVQPVQQGPGAPFNVPPGASATPGVIAPVPTPGQQQGTRPRPPV
jgi:hypothetical protein